MNKTTPPTSKGIPAFCLYKLHLGPGPTWVKLSYQWVSVDKDPYCVDICGDFHCFEGLLIETESLDSVYASHTLELVSMYMINNLPSECYRVLRRVGIMRIVVPNPKESIRQYLTGNDDFPFSQEA